MSKSSDSRSALSGFFSTPDSKSSPAPVLITESREEYRRLRRALRKEIGPEGPLERMYIRDIGQLEWEIRRWRRAKVALLNAAFRDALRDVISEVMCGPDDVSWELTDKANELAFAWFSDQEVQQRIAQRLEEFGLDATAIEAKVLQSCSSRLGEFDRLLASAESRRTKSVRALAEYRSSLRRHIRTKKRASTSRRDRRR